MNENAVAIDAISFEEMIRLTPEGKLELVSDQLLGRDCFALFFLQAKLAAVKL